MDPIAILALALATVTAFVVVTGRVRQMLSEMDAAKAQDAILEAGEALQDAGGIMTDVAAITRNSNRVQADSIGELERARREIEFANREWAKIHESTDPVGAELTLPANFAMWKDDGDEHYVQVTGWVNGGGVDVQVAINRAPCNLSLTWKELDVMQSLAGRIRVKDSEADEPAGMIEASYDDPRVIEASEALDFPEVDLGLFWAEMVRGADDVAADEEVNDKCDSHGVDDADKEFDTYHSE